jgi:hypothetical protein
MSTGITLYQRVTDLKGSFLVKISFHNLLFKVFMNQATESTTLERAGQQILDKEFSAKEVQSILRALTGGVEKIGLALLNYYARTNLVPASGRSRQRGRKKYTYADLVLLCWLFRMKREGLPVNRFRRGIDYLRKRINKLHGNPQEMVLLTDGKQLFLKHRVDEKNEIAEVITGRKAGQYVWVYAIGSLIEEVDAIVNELSAGETVSKADMDETLESQVA